MGQIAAHEGLAAREPDAVDAQSGERVDEPADLLEVEDVLAGQPGVVRLRACSTRSAGCIGP